MYNISTHSNRADRGNGGGLHIRSSGIIDSRKSVTQCQFINNTANQGSGGAIYELSNDRNLNSSVMTQCQFINNTASISGGAIYRNGRNKMLLLDQNIYNNNTASAFGGAVYANGTNSSVHVTDTTFVENTAITEGGGAIYSNGRYANVTLTSSTFHNNSASYCSVLDVDNYNHFSVNLTNSIFAYKTASGQTIGGGVACIRNASINIINSTFKHNFANHHAGVFT